MIQPFHQTDIRYEPHDLVLYKRLDKSHRWEKVDVMDLPEVCYDPDLLTKPTGTPPRGRARLNSKRKRDSPNSSGDETTKKTPKFLTSPNANNLDVVTVVPSTSNICDDSEALQRADKGVIADVHAFSPSRPAPPKHSMISTNTGALSKLIQPKLAYKPVPKSFQ